MFVVIFLALLLLTGSPAVRVLWWQRLVLAAATGSIILLIAVSQYVLWPADGTDHIRMQGRYLLPIAPLVVLALNRRPQREPPTLGIAVALGLAHLLITAAVWATMIGRYYG